MGKINEARRHAKQIEHYYYNAGGRGYRQAVYHWNELNNLLIGAKKNDAPIIEGIRQSVKSMVDEMKENAE
jgi:hypothetical protein